MKTTFLQKFSPNQINVYKQTEQTILYYFSIDLRFIVGMKHKLDDVEIENRKKKFDILSEEEEPRPGPSNSRSTNSFQVSRHLPPNLNFSDSDSDDDDYDRESLLKNIDLDLQRIISR